MSLITNKVGELYRDLVSKELKKKLNNSSDVFLLNYHNLKSADMTQLRKNLKAAGASVLVAKNSFIRKAFEAANKPADALPQVDGPMAMVFVKDDPIGVSRIIVGFIKDHEALSIKGGFLAERLLSVDDVKKIAKLSSREALYAQIAMTLNAPITKLAATLNQITTKLVYALNAVKDKKK